MNRRSWLQGWVFALLVRVPARTYAPMPARVPSFTLPISFPFAFTGKVSK